MQDFDAARRMKARNVLNPPQKTAGPMEYIVRTIRSTKKRNHIDMFAVLFSRTKSEYDFMLKVEI